MLEFLEMSCPFLLILVSTFTSLRLCRLYGLNFNTKQPLQLLFGEPGMTSCFCTSKESKHISMCYFKKKKKEGYFFPPSTGSNTCCQATWKKGCRQGRMSENVRVKVSSVHLCVYPTRVHSQQHRKHMPPFVWFLRIQSPSSV